MLLNSGDTGDDTAEYLDTFSIGMTFSSVGDLTVGGGFESATSENNDCDLAATLAVADGPPVITAAALPDDAHGTEHCGDQDLSRYRCRICNG